MKGSVLRNFFIGFSVMAIGNVCYAADDLPKFECTLTDQVSDKGEPGEAKDTFTKTTPVLYFICQSDEVEQGQTLKGVWIADDTNGVAPANYQIGEKSIKITEKLEEDQVYTASFKLSIPDKGWPVGSYHVEVYDDEDKVESVPFTIK